MTGPPRECILIGTLPPPTTGQSVAFRMLVDGCVRHGVPHRVIDISERGRERRVGGFSWRRATSLCGPLWRALRWCALARRVTYLIVAQSWFGFLRDRLFVALAALGRNRIVLHVHGGGYREFWLAQSERRRRSIRRTLARADRIVVLGSGLVDMLDFVPDHARKVVVVPNGLALDEAGLPSRPKALPAAGPIRLLFLSNLIESKGWRDVLEAVRILVARGVDVSCEFCGAFLVGADAERYATVADAEAGFRAFVADHRLGDHVRLRGVVHGVELTRALEAAHFVVLPTRYDNEGQPLSIIEAMAHGCVVLSTRYRAIPEMLDDGRAGVFVEAGEPATIAAAVEELRTDPARYTALSERAIAHRRANFTAIRHLERMLAVLRFD